MPRPLSADKLLLRRLEGASVPLVVFDAARRIVFANRALGQWLGRQSAALVGQQASYQTSTGDELQAAANGLCPPPEAFAGTASDGFVSRTMPGSPFERRPARFLLIAGERSEEALLFTLVLPEAAGGEGTGGPETPAELHGMLARVRSQLGQRYDLGQLIGVSPAMRQLRQQVAVASEAAASVLVVGPPGSGREHIARAIHYAATGAAALWPIACPLVDAEQLQATLTKALKHTEAGGPPPSVLLLDADRLRSQAQHELAAFLRLPNVALRLLATARRPLVRLAAKGKYRQDLAFLLSTLTLAVPPLAERREDIPLLAQHFLEEANAEGGRQWAGFEPPALELLARLPWAGNVDQLAQAVREARERGAGPHIGLADLPDWVQLAGSAGSPSAKLHVKLDSLLAEIEKEIIDRALAAARGNKSRAAAMLGVSRPRLLRRMTQLGLAAPAASEEPVIFEQVSDETEPS